MPLPAPTLYPSPNLYPEADLTPPPVAVAAERNYRELMPRLAMSIQTADGVVWRWGGDEPDARRIPRGLTLTSSDPGGWKDLSWASARRADVELPDLNPLDDVRVYTAGERSVWEGRVSEIPLEHGEDHVASPIAVGWQAHMLDDPSFVEIYVDRDPERWQPPTVARRLSTVGSPPVYFGTAPSETDFSVTSDVGVPLQFAGVTGHLYVQTSNAERWYIAPPGCAVSKISYRGLDVAYDAANLEAPTWFGTSDIDGASGGVSTALTFDDSLRTASIASANRRRFNMMRAFAKTAAYNPAQAFNRTVRKLAVYGNHGIATRASQVAGEPDGIYASDIVADVVRRTCPLLKIASWSIDPTNYPIPHLTFLDPTTAADVIAQLNVYHQRFWGVYEDRTFYYRAQDNPRKRWRCRLDDGAALSQEGRQAEELFDGVIVRFTDPDGISRTIGPTGATGVDYTSSDLLDTDPTNEVNRHGLARKWALVELDIITDTAGAATLGAVMLAESKALSHRGQILLRGRVRDDRRTWWPAWDVRAGDTVVVEDAADSAERRIIEATYSHDDRAVTLTLDNTPHRFDALMERMGAALTGLNIGGGG